MRFINRNHAISALKNKKQLSMKNEYKKYMIQENLSPGNKAIYKKEGEIKNLWTYNGVVHIKFSTDLEEPPMKIFHKDDIELYMNYHSSFEVISWIYYLYIFSIIFHIYFILLFIYILYYFLLGIFVVCLFVLFQSTLLDFHKMTVTVLKSYFKKKRPKIVRYRDYKVFSNINFVRHLDSILTGYDINNIGYDNFHDICMNLLNKYVPIKYKYLRANDGPFMNKELR